MNIGKFIIFTALVTLGFALAAYGGNGSVWTGTGWLDSGTAEVPVGSVQVAENGGSQIWAGTKWVSAPVWQSKAYTAGNVWTGSQWTPESKLPPEVFAIKFSDDGKKFNRTGAGWQADPAWMGVQKLASFIGSAPKARGKGLQDKGSVTAASKGAANSEAGALASPGSLGSTGNSGSSANGGGVSSNAATMPGTVGSADAATNRAAASAPGNSAGNSASTSQSPSSNVPFAAALQQTPSADGTAPKNSQTGDQTGAKESGSLLQKAASVGQEVASSALNHGNAAGNLEEARVHKSFGGSHDPNNPDDHTPDDSHLNTGLNLPNPPAGPVTPPGASGNSDQQASAPGSGLRNFAAADSENTAGLLNPQAIGGSKNHTGNALLNPELSDAAKAAAAAKVGNVPASTGTTPVGVAAPSTAKPLQATSAGLTTVGSTTTSSVTAANRSVSTTGNVSTTTSSASRVVASTLTAPPAPTHSSSAAVTQTTNIWGTGNGSTGSNHDGGWGSNTATGSGFAPAESMGLVGGGKGAAN